MLCITRHDDVMTWEGFPHYWPFSWWRHQMETFSASLAICAGNSWFTLICARINGWINNREAGDLRRRCTHYDAIVMCKGNPMVASHGRTHSSALLIVISIATVSSSVSLWYLSVALRCSWCQSRLCLKQSKFKRIHMSWCYGSWTDGLFNMQIQGITVVVYCVFFATDWSLRPNSLSWYCLGGPGGWQVKRLEWLENWFSCCKAIFSSGVPAVFEC